MQFRQTDGDAVSLRVEHIERVRLRFLRFTAGEQCRDQVGREFLWANAIVRGGSGRNPTALPFELDRNRLNLFRDPSAVNASKGQYVVATRSNGADFVFVVREYDCFENGSVGVSDGHSYIVHARTWRKPVLGGPGRSQDHTNVNGFPFSEMNLQAWFREIGAYLRPSSTALLKSPRGGGRRSADWPWKALANCFSFLFPDLRCRPRHGRHEVDFRLKPIPALRADQQVLFQRPCLGISKGLDGVSLQRIMGNVLHDFHGPLFL